MDLIYNRCPIFTKCALERSLLRGPLTLVDVGVYGGIHPRWRHLNNMIEVHGFDAREEAITPLREIAASSERYYAMALGNEDGERDLFITAEPAATSFYNQTPSAYAVDRRVTTTEGIRKVPIRRLDSLAAEGMIPNADFIKIDCEGFEPEILKGAQRMIASYVLGVEVEASFNTSSALPQGHFSAVAEQLLPHGFKLQDIAFNRIQNATFAARAKALGIRRAATQSRPATLNLLFCRDTAPTTADEVLKRAIILELYSLNDAAYDLLERYGDALPLGLKDKLIRRRTPREYARLARDILTLWRAPQIRS